MFKSSKIVAAAGMTAALSFAPAAVYADSSLGQLVYYFTYSSNQQIAARDSSDNAQAVDSESAGLAGGTNGISHYNGVLTDKGTMTVGILGKQPDGGLILSISEAGETTRRAPPATCVVYGNTNVICDPNKTVYTEEYTLLRFLGLNFINPTNLDAKRHWHVTQDSPTMKVTADYVLGPTTSSDVQVSETRAIRDPNRTNFTTDIQTKIGYDMSRSIPTSVDEYVTQRQDQGVAGFSTTIYQTTLKLQSYSVGKT